MTKKSDLPPAPAHLTAATADWWREIVSEYRLEQSDLLVLETAATQWDRAVTARRAIAQSKDGPFAKDRFGQLKTHPAVDIEQNATRLFLAAIRQIGLGLESPDANRLPDPVGRYKRD